MLSWRIGLGIALVALLLGLCWLDVRADHPGAYLLPIAAAIALAATGELLTMMAAGGLSTIPIVCYAGNLAIVLAAGLTVPWSWRPAWLAATDPAWAVLAATTLAVIAAFVVEMIRYREPGGVVKRLVGTWAVLIYAGVLTSFLVQLRMHGPSATGMAALLSTVAVVKLGDTGAYTVGRLWGRRKLAPLLSPGKSIEGAAGGLACSVLAGWLTLSVLWPALDAAASPPAWWATLLYGLIVGVAGIIGDLAESLIKRDLGQKDSSNWMPGFGGVLDVIDSLLVAAPVALFCWRCW